ncbi:hypothetical protein GMD88_10680 [Pseudoflavonifractor sp. BIOML-A6]|nr:MULTISPECIES: hypothetical protein [unclassified Pseudoflavonifractor]KAB4605891.1 hypothetical protein GA029_26325 [Bacteroides thetaiotaomicron]MTQ97466.1 hypothetical protein [Pseudoflavonifractor sp. BIOML-A16]MTR06572.1 hypothetical protein [Pseudoflavonifractor sp. BIOML-A15]MTR31953.1 hypothetical protein [Pseudoflavonifractor sp. BIOML-A14]MTR74059.1 hypothetical protein [Pseudoflavonifractor sp. BIOML-A18]MTS64504.1 hypothetical protein [Pseudoflavonifractor sp. BIOML-A5]MTS72686
MEDHKTRQDASRRSGGKEPKMNELKKLASEYFMLEDKCDGTAKTFAALHPLAEDLAKRVEDLQRKVRSRETRYFTLKLYQDIRDMERRFWKYTIY